MQSTTCDIMTFMETMNDGKGKLGDKDFWVGITNVEKELTTLKSTYKTGPKGVDSAYTKVSNAQTTLILIMIK